MGLYRFPESTQAADGTLDDAMAKLQHECGEAIADYVAKDDDRLCYQLCDVICAAEQALRKYPKGMVEQAFLSVREKVKRGAAR